MTAAYSSMRGASLSTAVSAPSPSYGSIVRRPTASSACAPGTVLAVAGIGWGLWMGRRASDLSLTAAIAAFSVCAYSVSRHECTRTTLSSLFRCRSSRCSRRRFVPVMAAVSAWFTLNLVFYGVASDDGRFAIPRTFTVVDTTLLVAVFGCLSLFWFASVLGAECRSSGERA